MRQSRLYGSVRGVRGNLHPYRDKLGFAPDPIQARPLESESKRVILNCTRQWAKSTVSAAKAVHLAATQKDSLILVVSPCERQSGEFLRKAAGSCGGCV